MTIFKYLLSMFRGQIVIIVVWFFDEI